MTFVEIEEELLRCMRCGECQAVCPTFSVTGRDGEVARGKLRVIKALLQGDLDLDEGVAEKLSICLLCKACCTACPSGVRVDQVIAAVRKDIADRRGIPFKKRAVLWGLEHPRIFSTAASMARVLGILPRRVSKRIPSSDAVPPERARVIFYAGCMINNITPEIGDAVETILEKAGYRVERIKETCCGIPAYFAGLHDRAKMLAEKNLRKIKKNRFVVTACPTCAVGLKEYPEFFRGKLREKALEVSSRTHDFAEFLDASKLRDSLGSLNMRVAFHDPCHAVHGLGLAKESRSLIKAIHGIKLMEMEQGCCGFGGLFSFEHPSFSQTINDSRVKDITASNADAVVTSCPGCKYYLQEGIRRGRKKTEVMHVAELLSRGIR